MKRTREERQEKEGERDQEPQEKKEDDDDAARATKVARKTVTSETDGQGTSTADEGLERVGDDVLLIVMGMCGLRDSLRAFFLANKHLHSLVCRHQSLWRKAYTKLWAHKTAPPQEDYFRAYIDVMDKYHGSHEYYEDGVPLGETEGELTITVDFFGRATWEGFGVGCGRAGEYFSLNCLKGEGRLVLKAGKNGKVQALVKGRESSEQSSCDRDNDDEDDEDEDESDEDDDNDDGEDNEDDDDGDEETKELKKKAREEKKQQLREERREKRREERRKEKEAEREGEITESNWNEWVQETLATFTPPYLSSVTYRLTKSGCSGGSACQGWQEDMEW